jgi:hypothetical protein
MSPVVGSIPWTPEEDKRLRTLALSGISVAAMATQIRVARFWRLETGSQFAKARNWPGIYAIYDSTVSSWIRTSI